VNAFPHVNLADLAALVFVLASIAMGFRRGLSGQVAMLLAVLLVVVGTYFTYPLCLALLTRFTAVPTESVHVAALTVALLIPLGIVLVIRNLLGNVLKITFVAWLDRIGGAVAGAISSTLFVLLVFVVMNVLPTPYRFAAFGSPSWIGRLVTQSESNIVQRVETKIQRTRSAILRARQEHAGQREKWEQ
jgi:uncharacterized membrane protein required for colicin V production